jgi:hypothetical protein
MLVKVQFEQQAEWMEERSRLLSALDRSRATDRPENPQNQFKIVEIVDPIRYS